MRLLYVLGGALFAFGLLIAHGDMQRFGLILLLVTGGVTLRIAIFR